MAPSDPASRRRFLQGWAIVMAGAVVGCTAPAQPAPTTAPSGVSPAPAASPAAQAAPSVSASPAAVASAVPSPVVAVSPVAQASAAPAAGNLTGITAAVTSTSQSQMAFPVAQQQGLFAKYGLDLNLFINPQVMPSLLSGQVQVIDTSTEDVIGAVLQGGPVTIIATLIPYLVQVIEVRPEIKTFQDLVGKTVGVTRRGNITETALRIALQRNGVDPSSVTYLAMGGPAQQVAGMVAGSVSAGSFSRPNSDSAEQQGMHPLFDFTPEHIPFPESNIIVQKSWASQNQNTVLGVLKALAEATVLTSTNPDVCAQIYAQWAKLSVADGQVAAQLAAEDVPIRAIPTASGIKAVLDSVAQSSPDAANAKPSQFFDDSYIKLLDRQGFYASLPQVGPPSPG